MTDFQWKSSSRCACVPATSFAIRVCPASSRPWYASTSTDTTTAIVPMMSTSTSCLIR